MYYDESISFFQAVIREMNRLGMLVDLSHVSQRVMLATLRQTEAPVIFSHSSAHQLCNNSRNVPDYILKKLVRIMISHLKYCLVKLKFHGNAIFGVYLRMS